MDKREIAGTAVWLTLSVFVFTAALDLGIGTFSNPGAGFIPFWAGIGLAFFAALLQVSLFYGKTEPSRRDHSREGANRKNNAIAVAAVLLYCALLSTLGYLLSTFGLMLVLFGLGKMRFRARVIGSLIAAVSSYGLFVYAFGTPLPRGVLGI